MHAFDRPLFKRLAPNDTASAAGHQGGVVIPKEMDPYFPQLIGTVSAAIPTVDKTVRAALFVGDLQVGLVDTRYQYQTWGGVRSPERRLTGNLGAIRLPATGGDYLLIERSLSSPDSYRLTLHKAGTPGHSAIAAKAAGRKWGPLDPADAPVSETAIITFETEQEQRELNPFSLFDNAADLVETRTTRVARSAAFKRRLLPLYDFRCAVCGLAHADANGIWEAEAAHIVPRSLKGSDDARNGLALCRSHHWAFDRGLFGIKPNRQIVLRPAAAADGRNSHLLPFSGQPVKQPSNPALNPAPDALAWHLVNVVRLSAHENTETV
jgi:putative restriction endonuclease